jgi:hypothetical protein
LKAQRNNWQALSADLTISESSMSRIKQQKARTNVRIMSAENGDFPSPSRRNATQEAKES